MKLIFSHHKEKRGGRGWHLHYRGFKSPSVHSTFFMEELWLRTCFFELEAEIEVFVLLLEVGFNLTSKKFVHKSRIKLRLQTSRNSSDKP